jgi:TetR/AcrR family fatty acid metabolism transcriptional regulator
VPSRKRRLILQPDARRRQLLAAAISVFAQRGYRAAGISDIVATAGVARGTFYLYFASKAEVFLAIADDFYDRLELQIAHGASPDLTAGLPDGRAFLHASVRRWFEFFHTHRLAATVMLKEAAAIDPRFDRGVAELRRSAYAHLAARFRRFQELGMVRSSLSADIVAHLQVGMFEELVKAFVLAADNPDLDSLAEQMADFEWNGVRPAAR